MRQEPFLGGQTLRIAAAFAFAVVIAVGLLTFRVWPDNRPARTGAAGASARPSPTAKSSSQHAPAFAATGGPFCSQKSTVLTNAYHDPHGDGWHIASARHGECGVHFLYTQLARVASDPNQWQDDYDWTFNTGLASPRCTLDFLIPASAHANSTVHYWTSAGSQNFDSQIASFTIDQRADRGRWVSRGPFVFPGGTVFVELTDNGEGLPTAQAVVAPVRVTC